MKILRLFKIEKEKVSICKYGQIVKEFRDCCGCLRITCEDVGGYWDLSGYFEGA